MPNSLVLRDRKERGSILIIRAYINVVISSIPYILGAVIEDDEFDWILLLDGLHVLEDMILKTALNIILGIKGKEEKIQKRT